MTTIAYKDGIVAADSQITQDDVKYLSNDKITVISNNLVIAGSGDCGDILRLEKWLKDYPEDWLDKLEKKPAIKKSLDAIILFQGKPYIIFRDNYPELLGHPFMAFGSGWKFAMAAMHLGLSAPDAVNLAAEFDINTNNRIKYLNVTELQGSTKAVSRAKKRGTQAATLVQAKEAGTGVKGSQG